MEAKKMLNRKLILGIIFVVIGYFSLQYSFERPCELGQMAADVGGQEYEVGITIPYQIQKLACLVSDFSGILALLIGVACIFSGIGGIFKGLTID